MNEQNNQEKDVLKGSTNHKAAFAPENEPPLLQGDSVDWFIEDDLDIEQNSCRVNHFVLIDILFKHGEDDFSFWKVEVAETEMKQFYGKGSIESGSLDEVIDLVKDLESHPNTIHLFHFYDDFMSLWTVEAEQAFFEKYRNDGCSIRGTRNEIKDYITEYTEMIIEKEFNSYYGIEDVYDNPSLKDGQDKFQPRHRNPKEPA